jgi:hypothetical protein
MLTKNPQPFLPPDLVLYVIDFIPPASNTAKIAYEPSHILTRTLSLLIGMFHCGEGHCFRFGRCRGIEENAGFFGRIALSSAQRFDRMSEEVRRERHLDMCSARDEFGTRELGKRGMSWSTDDEGQKSSFRRGDIAPRWCPPAQSVVHFTLESSHKLHVENSESRRNLTTKKIKVLDFAFVCESYPV